jgi:LacI family transcriptional regulator
MVKRSKKVTLKDIAARAGVSMTAASMYLNGKAKKYHIADETCERIKKAIKDLKYVPNIHARAIASKRTLLVGTVISTSIETSFWLNILSGIEETLIKDNYHMILSVSRGDAGNELDSIEFMLNKGIDGLLITPVVGEENNLDFLRDLSKDIPVVTINRPVEGLCGAYNDNSSGGAMAADFLLQNGHSKIAYIGSEKENRARAFKEKLVLNQVNSVTFSSVTEFIPEYRNFTAVFCYSDYIALELYNEAAALGIQIPDDLSIVGYDNMEFARYTKPRLTTIRQHKKPIGTSAAAMLMKALHNKPVNPSEDSEIFQPLLIDAESVKSIL